MTEQPADPREREARREEAAPEATSPFTDSETDEAQGTGRDVEEDVHDNADLDG